MKQFQSACPSEMYLQLLQHIHFGIVILNLQDKKVCFCNQAATDILNKIKQDITYEVLFPVIEKSIIEFLDTDNIEERESTLNTDEKFTSYTVHIFDPECQYISIIIQDITNQKRMDSIAESAINMNNVGTIFSGIRHEIGNPLNSIKMAITVLQKNIHKYSPEEIEVYFKRIFEDIARIEQLLKSFKNFNMYEQPKTEVMDLSDFIMHNTQLITAYSNVKDQIISISVDVEPGSEYVMVDRRALQQVSMNILANAMDAMQNNDNAELLISSYKNGPNICLEIKDNGCGIPPESIYDVFKPFYTTKEKGTGLGLALSKKMLAQMNCGIDIKSVYGESTIVQITIPKAQAHEIKACTTQQPATQVTAES
jgi:C4-dicarboxylate-specific signal transduction histidine kinase